MNNIEKLTAVGKAVYGDNWQSPVSRDLGIDSRTIRHFIKGERDIFNLSPRLTAALEAKIEGIKAAIDIINSDKMNGEDVTIEMIAGIADKYEFDNDNIRSAAIDAMNNAVSAQTFLSDLEAIAQKWANS